MPGIPLRLHAFLFKRETTFRVDPVPTAAANGIRLNENLWPQITVDYAWENLREDVATGTMLPVAPARPRGRRVRIRVPAELKGAGIDAPPEVGDLYRASLMTETDGASLTDYTQASQLHDSGTAYCYAAGHLFKVVGCRGHLVSPIVVGERSVDIVELQGFLDTEPAPAAPPATTYDTSEPLVGVGLTCTIGAHTPEILSGEFNQGIPQLDQLDDGNAADGIKEFDYGGVVAPTLTLVTRVPRDGAGIWDQAAYDPWSDARLRTARAINLTQGSAQFNRRKIIITNAYLQVPPPEGAQTFAAWRLAFRLTDWILRWD